MNKQRISPFTLTFLVLATGLVVTLLTSLYSGTTTGLYCSPNAAANATRDCNLQVKNKGLPFAYNFEPYYQPKHGLQPVPLVIDWAIWSVAGGGLFLLARRLKA